MNAILCRTCKRADLDWHELQEIKKGSKLVKFNPILSECFEKSKQFPDATECEKYQAEREMVKLEIEIPREIYEDMKRAEKIYRQKHYPLHVAILDGRVIEEEGNT